MNELQKTEFEILKCFVNACEKLNLNYFLVCGSALGAVKYHGFIPWDDDIDVALTREDYEVFIKRAAEFLPDHIFIQNYHTQEQFAACYTKLRNSKTTFIEEASSYQKINHGAYIDVFPLDGYPVKKNEQIKLEFLKSLYTNLLYSAFSFNNPNMKLKVIMSVSRAFGINQRTNLICRKLDALLASFPTQTSNLWCNHGNWQGKKEYAEKEQYGNGMEAQFEGLTVRIPELYDEYLTQKYGDWRSDLPLEEQVGHHKAVICDLNRPYTAYVE